MQSADLDIHAVRAWYITDSIHDIYLRHRLHTIEKRRPLIYLGEVDICISFWPLEPEEKKIMMMKHV